MFKCDRCGACCRNLNQSVLYKDMDRGDGVCKYLEGNNCSIYKERPIFCRVDENFEKYFKDVMTIEEYYMLNEKVCKELKKKEELLCHCHFC